MKKAIIIFFLLLISIGIYLAIFFYRQKKYQKADIYYYSSFEKNKIFKETINILADSNSDFKLTKIINQILLGPKNSLEKGSQNKQIRCVKAFYLNKTVFVYLTQQFSLLSENEIKQTLKSIAKTLNGKIKNKEKFLKIIIKDFHWTESKSKILFNFNNKISFEKILNQL